MKKHIKQKFATRTLNKQNRVLFAKNAQALANQLLVLRAVNDKIAGRQEESASTYFRSSFGDSVGTR